MVAPATGFTAGPERTERFHRRDDLGRQRAKTHIFLYGNTIHILQAFRRQRPAQGILHLFRQEREKDVRRGSPA